MMTLTVEIPALDRLCSILENRDKAGLVEAIEQEIVAKLKEAAEGGTPKPEFKVVEPETDHPWKEEIAPEAPETPSEPPKAKAKKETAEAPASVPASKPVDLADVQKAAAEMRDQGKLGAVTGMFGEFGIKKLSDLKGEQLQAFAERLRKMGAKL